MRTDRLPLTYDECRARFRRAAAEAGVELHHHPIAAPGPEGQELSIDWVWLGAERPRRALTVLSGTHGVEAFLPSVLQSELLGRLDAATLPDDLAVWVVHAVNPWGMAWGRRQNEHNVDLNRNWRRSEIDPAPNDAYDELHPLACPDTDELPSIDDLLVAAAGIVAERGLAWVRSGITAGQYRHPDGLHYGGTETEESNRILEGLVAERLTGVERSLALDLHTGHGPRATVTYLCDSPPDSERHALLTRAAGPDRVEATTGNPDATTGPKSGQIANGFAALLPGTVHHASSVEFGTASDEEQLAATYLEQWVHRRGDRTTPAHAEVAWRYRCCFTPDDPEWERTCLAAGRAVLDRALTTVADWEG